MKNTNLKKKLFVITLSLAMAFSGIYMGTWMGRAETGIKASGSISVDAAYMRKGPGTSYERVKLLYKGASVFIEEEVYTKEGSQNPEDVWLYLENGGYTRSDLVSKTYSHYEGQTTDYLNVRDYPSLSGNRVGVLAKSAKVKVVMPVKNQAGERWYKILYNGSYYFVHGNYVHTSDNVTGITNGGNTSSFSSSSNSSSSSSGGSRSSSEASNTNGSSGANSSSTPTDVNKGITTEPLNIRTGPSTGYPVVASFKKGTSVDIVSSTKDGKGTTWYKIKYGSKNYYVCGDFVDTNYGKAGSGSESSSNRGNGDGLPNIGSDTKAVTTYVYTGKTTTYVNIRTGAGINNRLVKTLAPGTTFEITGSAPDSSGTKWYKLKQGANTYYIISTYVDVTTKKVTIAVPVDKVNSSPSGRSDGSSNNSNSGQSSNESASSDTEEPTSLTYNGKVLGNVNIRTGPGLGYKIVKTTSKDYPVNVTGSSYDEDGKLWYELTEGSSKYYAFGEYVETTYQAPPRVVYGKITDFLNIRTGAGTTNKVAFVYGPGTRVKVVGKESASDGSLWYKLEIGGKTYFAAGNWIQLEDEGATSGGSTSNSSSAGGGSGSDTPSNPVESKVAKMSDREFDSYLASQGFPESYRTKLVALHREHPTWDFIGVNTGLDWNSAFSKMTSNQSANTIQNIFPDSYKEVAPNAYDFLGNRYIGKDGAAFVVAAPEAVAYYMDPRNFMTDDTIFMFEDHSYHNTYQSLDMVKKILKPNSVLYSHASDFVKYGEMYNISPVYLASKAILESGSGTFTLDGHSFSFGGRNYSGLYNVFNIGAYDAAYGGAINGLIYAGGGASGEGTSYGRPWNTVEKAIAGGAQYIAKSFVGNRQSSFYSEHFNVYNGYSAVGTHVYATAVFSPKSLSSQSYKAYSSYGILDQALEFYIPIYKDMPRQALPMPGSGDNNAYLRSLKVVGDRNYNLIVTSSSTINSVYETNFEINVPSSQDTIILEGESHSGNAVISGLGRKNLSMGQNVFRIRVMSTAGRVRDYTVTVNRV